MNEEIDPVERLVKLAGRRPRPDAELTARVRQAVHDEWQEEVRGRSRKKMFAAAAAVVFVVMGAAYFALRPKPSPVIATEIVARVQTISGSTAVSAGQMIRSGETLELPAGAVASLDWNGVTLRVDGGTRVRLDGRDAASLESGAVFIATEGASRLTVHTRYGDVRDIGTRFEVRMRDETVRVRVREGLVSMRGVKAGAGTEIRATKAHLSQHEIAVAGDEWSWIERAAPPVILGGKTLGEVVQLVAREKGLALEWKNSTRRDAQLHGNMALGIDEALDAATAATGATYSINGQRLIVSAR